MKQDSMPTNKAIFLDRDGVLNRAIVRDGKPYPPHDVAEVEILAGVSDALQQLKAAGFLLITVSNQPDVSRGTLSRSTVDSINAFLGDQLPIDRFIMCYHDSGNGCDCRKPKPGMILRGAAEFQINLGESFMIGDRWRDVVAGNNAGCKTIFIDYGYDEQQPTSFDYVAGSLLEASQIILSMEGNREAS